MHTLTKQPVKCKAGNVEHKKLHRKKVQFPRSYFMRHFKEFVWIKRWMALNKNLVLKVWKNMRSSGEIPRKGFNEYVLEKEKKKNKVQLLYLLFFKVRQSWPFSLKSKIYWNRMFSEKSLLGVLRRRRTKRLSRRRSSGHCNWRCNLRKWPKT